VLQGVGVSRVTCYLALMVEGSDRLEVAFPRLLPRLPLLTPVREAVVHAHTAGHAASSLLLTG
jgi:hypothetical protein